MLTMCVLFSACRYVRHLLHTDALYCVGRQSADAASGVPIKLSIVSDSPDKTINFLPLELSTLCYAPDKTME